MGTRSRNAIKKLKMIFLLYTLLLFQDTIFSQVSNNIDFFKFEQESEQPVYLEFYNQQKVKEIPEVKYEDIEVKYPFLVDPDIRKLNLNYYFFNSSPTFDLSTKLLFGMSNMNLNTSYKGISSDSTEIKINVQTKKIETGEYLKDDSFNFIFIKPYNNAILNFNMDLRSRFLDTKLESYKILLIYEKSIYPNLNFSFKPNIFYTKEAINNFYYSNYYADFGLVYSRYCNFLLGLQYKPILINNKASNYYNFDLVLKDIVNVDSKILTSFSFLENFDNIYYSFLLEKKFNNYFIEIKSQKKYDHEFYESFFNKYANIMFFDEHFLVPNIIENIISLEYKKSNLNSKISFIDKIYDKYPSYIEYQNKFLKYYLVKDLNVRSLSFIVGNNINKFLSSYFNINYLLNENDILFLPKYDVDSSIKMNLKILDIKYNFGFSIHWYSKMLVDDILKKYLEERIYGEVNLTISSNNVLFLFFSYFFPLKSKLYLQPNIVFQPEMMFGIKLNFN